MVIEAVTARFFSPGCGPEPAQVQAVLDGLVQDRRRSCSIGTPDLMRCPRGSTAWRTSCAPPWRWACRRPQPLPTLTTGGARRAAWHRAAAHRDAAARGRHRNGVATPSNARRRGVPAVAAPRRAWYTSTRSNDCPVCRRGRPNLLLLARVRRPWTAARFFVAMPPHADVCDRGRRQECVDI